MVVSEKPGSSEETDWVTAANRTTLQTHGLSHCSADQDIRIKLLSTIKLKYQQYYILSDQKKILCLLGGKTDQAVKQPEGEAAEQHIKP